MHVVTEAANWLWLQQRVDPLALAKQLDLNRAQVDLVLQRLHEQEVIQSNAAGWQVSAMPTHFFQKKGHSLIRTLTMYGRPIAGVIEPQIPFLTHSQSGEWWLVCNHVGRIGYIHVDTSRLVQLE